ncbi:MAG: hypothetical protein V4613_05445 [Bacteroidota bacterium]
MKIWKIIFYTLGVIPWSFIVTLMSFYYEAGNILGHAPTYDNPDPGELSIYKNYAPYIDFTAEVWLYSLILWIILCIVYIIAKRKEIQWTPIVISGIGQFWGIRLLFSDIFVWYID